MSDSSERDWMYRKYDSRGRLNPEFVRGIKGFVRHCLQNPTCMDKWNARCPCKKCDNRKYIHVKQIENHLLKSGFTPHYYVWNVHGEDKQKEDATVDSSVDKVNCIDNYSAKINAHYLALRDEQIAKGLSLDQIDDEALFIKAMLEFNKLGEDATFIMALGNFVKDKQSGGGASGDSYTPPLSSTTSGSSSQSSNTSGSSSPLSNDTVSLQIQLATLNAYINYLTARQDPGLGVIQPVIGRMQAALREWIGLRDGSTGSNS